MKIKCFGLGIYLTNCYLAYEDKKEAFFIDCGGAELEGLKKYVEENDIKIKALILTHGHHDHISGLEEFAKSFPDSIIYISEEEKEFLTEPNYSLSKMINGVAFKYEGEVTTVKDTDKIGPFTVMMTPGHTRGSMCLYSKENNILFSGDTMFKQSYGRYDLPTSSGEDLIKRLKKLSQLPLETVVLSAHSESTTIEEEIVFLKKQGMI